MSFNEIIQKSTSTYYIYILIALFVVLAVLIAVRISKKNSCRKRINEIQIKINDLKSHPFTVDITKAEAISRSNSNISDTIENCKKDFDTIQNNIKEAVDKLQDANEYLSNSNYKNTTKILDEIEPILKEATDLTESLEQVLSGILNESSLQRKRINELKAVFHDVKTIVNNDPNSFTYCWEALDRFTNDVSHKFSQFEAAMDSNQYEIAANTSNDIDESISKLNKLVSSLPDLINLAKNSLTFSLSELASEYALANGEGIFLSHLDIDNNIEAISHNLDDSLTLIKNCEIDGVDEKLLEIQTQINNLLSQLSEERNSYRELLSVKDKCANTLEIIKNTIDSISTDKDNNFNRYNLKELNEQFNELNKEYQNNLSSFNALQETFVSNSIPALTLVSTFKEIEKDIDSCALSAKQIEQNIMDSSTQEIRARELLSKFVVVLNESKASISLSRLPNISDKYHDDINKAEIAIKELNELLEQDILEMDVITQKLDETQNIIIGLFKNVTNIIETAKDIEDFIILCNKYRPYFPDIDSILYSAELAYRNGEYTKACKITVSALEKIDTQLAEELSDNLNKKLALAKEE